MSNREILRLAATAAGMLDQLGWGFDSDIPYYLGDPKQPAPRYWNPLADDGAALRLANLLKINVLHMSHLCENYWIEAGIGASWLAQERVSESDVHTAVRRAIVRAAAEIGKFTERLSHEGPGLSTAASPP